MSTYTSSPACAGFSLHSNFAAASAASIGASEFDLRGNSGEMSRMLLQVGRIGPHFRTVLIRGESGTEKEKVARRLHGLSQGSPGRFVRCHAGALENAVLNTAPEQSLDCLTRMAEGGTLFVDGVEELPLILQAKLLQILRRREFAESAGKTTQRTGFRAIASTCEELRVLASAGRFGQELYQRLATVEIVVSPLRERAEDIPELAQVLLDRMAGPGGSLRVSPEAMERMLSYSWPGNTRELENVLRSAALRCEGEVIEEDHLPVFTGPGITTVSKRDADENVRLQDVVGRHVMRVLQECGGNKLRAAERLGISRSTLYRMLDTGAAGRALR